MSFTLQNPGLKLKINLKYLLHENQGQRQYIIDFALSSFYNSHSNLYLFTIYIKIHHYEENLNMTQSNLCSDHWLTF